MGLQQHGLTTIPLLSFSLGEAELTAWRGRIVHPRHYVVWGYFQSLDSVTNRDFVRRFQARFGADRVTSDPIEASYNGLRLWANAVRETGSTEPLQVLRDLNGQSLSGPSGQIAVDGATHHLWRWVYIGHAEPSGQIQRLHSLPRPVRPVPYPTYRSPQEWRELQHRLDAPSKEGT
jgi:urea transport system substrate-binding protein